MPKSNDNDTEVKDLAKCQRKQSLDGNKQEQDGEQEDEGSYGAPCGLGLLERLLRSHPVWFLPGIQRAGAVHLLQGKDEGVFYKSYKIFYKSYKLIL